jgi:diguanylate cyclase (GGDEF)-like protein
LSLFEQLRDLEERGIDLIEVLGQDRHLRSPADLQAIIRSLDRGGEDLHAELLHFLTHRRFPAEEGPVIWDAILRHKRHMSERLGRPVRFRVAALDFFSAKTPRLRGVRLIAREDLAALLGRIDTDEVTALYTRRYFNERIALEVNRARRYGGCVSLLVLDLDDFKRVNDELGHVRGDAVLRRIGAMLRESTRESDVVCRFGGDEFAVILPETSNSESYTLAERIRAAAVTAGDSELGMITPGDGRRIRVGVSIGGASFPTDCDEAEELIIQADRLCLAAKKSGKNCVRMSGERKRQDRAAGPGTPKPADGGSPRGGAAEEISVDPASGLKDNRFLFDKE